jgi:hypothetical protein
MGIKRGKAKNIPVKEGHASKPITAEGVPDCENAEVGARELGVGGGR